MNTFLAQCKFEMLRTSRNRRFIIFTVLFPVGFYLLYTGIYGNSGYKVGGVPWNTYYMISMTTFGLVGGAINGLSSRVAFERTHGWMRLIQTTPLRNWQYFLSKVGAQWVLNILTTLIVFIFAGLVRHVHLPWSEWVLLAVALMFASLTFIALGMLIGVVAGSEAAQIIASGVYFLISIAGGIWFPITIMPNWLQDIAKTMPTYRMADLAWKIAGHQAIPGLDFIWLALYFAVFFLVALRIMRWQAGRLA